MSTEQKFESFAIVEVMGHSRYAGFVTEQAIGGASFVRVDVPAVGDIAAFTKLLGAGSIFAITPVSKETARAAAASYRATPVNVWEITVPAKRQLAGIEHDPEYGGPDDPI